MDTGGHEGWRHATPPQDDVDQATADPTVAIKERMDRFELSMGDRRLGDPGQIIAVDKCDQVLNQVLNLILRAGIPSSTSRANAETASMIARISADVGSRTVPLSGVRTLRVGAMSNVLKACRSVPVALDWSLAQANDVPVRRRTRWLARDR